MSMLDSFLNKGFNSFRGSKCKTLLKLSIPRIKLLRNRRESQLKQMRKDIAKLLETGQEATARIRVEHIIREENMMAAQEILELFCELISVRLPIIESQRECPLDLKEAISSICFAAPRCADLPELLQVQLAFASKYGKEFVAAASELMPDCGVNRQIVELLSVRAPSAEKKMKLLKEIAQEHEIDWDPAPSEAELFKSHEDLLNGPTQFVSGSKVPLPKENDEILHPTTDRVVDEHSESEEEYDELDFPEVPKVSVRPSVSADIVAPHPSAPHPEQYVAPETAFERDERSINHSISDPENTMQAAKSESPKSSFSPGMTKQFLPFITPPSLSEASAPVRESTQPINPPRTKSDAYHANVDLNDVLAAAKAAAESAERAAAAARTAASLAEVRISELIKSRNDQSPDRDAENPFHGSSSNLSAEMDNLRVDDGPTGDKDISYPWSPTEHVEQNQTAKGSKDTTDRATDLESSPAADNSFNYQRPQRIPSMEDESVFTYPNLFSSQGGNMPSGFPSFDKSLPRQGSDVK